ncbi:MAG: radical SAM protein [Thermodesulfobacteriota bacterium]|nr:radical SAM protein [Thermodesulfobacteriota bacterium]
MILIHPPVAKPCEPPGGIARLSGALNAHGIHHTLLDLNLEALLYTLYNAKPLSNKQTNKWTSRSFRNIADNLAALKDQYIYQNIDRYKRAVIDLNHAVENALNDTSITGLVDFRHRELSPLRSTDCIRAAEHPEHNPYYYYFAEKLPNLIEQDLSKVIGFSLNYLSQAICTFAMIGFLKHRYPQTTIVLGGGLVTSWMTNPRWKNPFKGLVDRFISGPGETALLSMLGIDNVRRYITPDYSSLPLGDYLAPGVILPYSASRGCYWGECSFCPEKAEGSRYVPIPVDRVREDLDNLIRTFQPALVHFVDSAVSVSVLKSLAQEPLGFPWYGFARFTHHLMDIDFCVSLRRSGCIMLKLGLESGDQGVLDKMQKGVDLKTASRALETLKKAGISTYIYLLFGTPTESLCEARKTLAFVAAHCEAITYLNLAIFNMPLFGAEAAGFETNSFYEGDLSVYTDFVHPKGWGRKQVRSFLEDEFKKHRAVSGIIKKTPPFFTSNHAPFFVIDSIKNLDNSHELL